MITFLRPVFHYHWISNGLNFHPNVRRVYEAKYLGQIFSQTFCFVEGQYLAQIKFQIVEQIGCVDAALRVIHMPVSGRMK